MEKIKTFFRTFWRLILAIAVCSASLTLPVPTGLYPWLKLEMLIILSIALALHLPSFKWYHFVSFTLFAHAVQIVIWALCGEYVTIFGVDFDIMWITPFILGNLLFWCWYFDHWSVQLVKAMCVSNLLLVVLMIAKLLAWILL